MRLRSTHQATVYGESVVETDALGTELTEAETALLTCPVRFNGNERQFVRSNTGEHVEQLPNAMLPPYGSDPASGNRVVSYDVVDVGMDVAFASEQWGIGSTERFSIESIDIKRRRGGRPERLDCQLQRHD